MKIALYIEDGLEQIVLTPDSETERSILGKIHDNTRELSIYSGEFYGCRGGWKRWRQSSGSYYGSSQSDDQSTMIVLRKKPDPPTIEIPPEGPNGEPIAQ